MARLSSATCDYDILFESFQIKREFDSIANQADFTRFNLLESVDSSCTF
jgi:hypothetical protein